MEDMIIIVWRYIQKAIFAVIIPILGFSACTTSEVEVIESSRSYGAPPQNRNILISHNPFTAAPHIINVSSYDPKEKQRSGSYYSEADVRALRKNGSLGLIARCGKGKQLDKDCASFLAAGERQRMLLGAYYFVLKGVDPVWQADKFVNQIKKIKLTKKLKTPEILLVGDFDSKSSVYDIIKFINRIEERTGQLPMIYLENSDHLRRVLSSASRSQKQRIAQCPYWIALYSSDKKEMETPNRLMAKYGIWNQWALWQYSGVYWNKRKSMSVIHNYSYGKYRSPKYYGDMSCPLERNIFNGTVDQLYSFWGKQSWKW